MGAKGSAKVETTVDYAMTNGFVQVGGNGGNVADCVAQTSGTYTLDLHGTQQKCQKLAVLTKGILTGDYPAMLEVIEGWTADGPAGYAVDGQVTGGYYLPAPMAPRARRASRARATPHT